MKVYKATDSLDGLESIFTVYDDGSISVAPAVLIDEEEVAYIREHGNALMRSRAERIEDMINPVLLAEW